MWRHAHLHIGLVLLIALATFFLMRMRAAGGATVAETSISEGHRLAQAWCESCHVIGPHLLDVAGQPPSFQAVANQPGMTPLALKVFLRTSHKDMPNIVISPDQAEALTNYILSLKAN
jgi:cytochrome c